MLVAKAGIISKQSQIYLIRGKISLIYTRNNKGPKQEPCGNPTFTISCSDTTLTKKKSLLDWLKDAHKTYKASQFNLWWILVKTSSSTDRWIKIYKNLMNSFVLSFISLRFFF